MNLIALPHTNEFVQIFKIGEPIDVSDTLDELIQETPPELRPVALLLLKGRSHRQVGREIGMSRSHVQKQAAFIKGQPEEIDAEAYDKTLWLSMSNEQRTEAVTKAIVELRAKNMTGEAVAEALNELGYRSAKGFKFTKRGVYEWMERHGIEMVPVRNYALYDMVVELRHSGLTFSDIAHRLNDRDIMTSRGVRWNRKSARQTYNSAMKCRRHVSKVGEK